MNSSRSKTKIIILIGIMGGISFILQLLEIHIFGFLAIEFSDIPSVVMAFIYGPFYGFLIEVIKNLIKMTVTKTAFVGEIANIIIGSAFVIPIGIYFKNKKRDKLLPAFLISIIIMTTIGALANYFILIPFYAQFVNGVDGIVRMLKSVIPIINNKFDIVLYYITPFNVIKGIIISVISVIFIRLKLYKIK